jgi:hypothetical protein
VTVTGNQAGVNVLETNFWDLQIGGTGTLTNEAFNQVHPYAYIGSGINISGYAGQFEGSALNDGTVNKFQSAYMLYTNGSAATTAAYTGYTVGATNNNPTLGSFGNFMGYECTGVGGGGTAPTYNWCVVNRDSTASIVSLGGIVTGTLANAAGPGTLFIQGANNSVGTFPVNIKNLAGANQFYVTNNFSAFFGGSLALGTAGSQWGKLLFANTTSGSLQLNAPSSGALSGTITLPNATTTLAGVAVAQTFSADQGFSAHVRAAGSAPALTSCGTSPAISGSDLAGTVTMGTGAPTGCVITFAVAYSSAPHCVVTWRATPLATQSYAVSTTAITLTQVATSSNVVDYVCMQ